MSGVFNFAIDEETIKANPVSGITKRLELKRDRSRNVDPLTVEELNLFLDTCNELVPEYYPFFLMAARTGMRLGELLAVHVGDLDFNSRFIWVRRSYRRGQVTPPKNGKERKVDMSDQLAESLKRHLTKAKKEALNRGTGEVPELLFRRNGRVIEQNYIRRVFKRILTKAGIRDIKLHGLRHTFASLLLSMGESPVYVKEQLGHSSIQITVDIYGKWIQTKKEAGVNRLDSVAPACTLSAPNPQNARLSACNH
ncbi:MAG: site-specific integrase [Deltaproteobacteria bacterium]|nr:site-specific integrase [Deltaproteobacteria bacterium]